MYYNAQTNTFIQTGSGDQRATKEEIDAMYRDQAFGTHSAKEIHKSTLQDIRESSYERYREYLSRFNPSHRYNRLQKEEFLQKLQILTDGKLTIGGALVLGTEDIIQHEIPDFRVDYLEIPGIDYSEAKERYTYRIYEQKICGSTSLPSLIVFEDSLTCLSNYHKKDLPPKIIPSWMPCVKLW